MNHFYPKIPTGAQISTQRPTLQTKRRKSISTYRVKCRLAPALKTIFHQCVISYICSQSNSDGSVLKTEPSELDWLQVYGMTHWWKIVLRTWASLGQANRYLKTYFLHNLPELQLSGDEPTASVSMSYMGYYKKSKIVSFKFSDWWNLRFCSSFNYCI